MQKISVIHIKILTGKKKLHQMSTYILFIEANNIIIINLIFSVNTKILTNTLHIVKVLN